MSNASDKTNLFTSEKDEKINSLMRSIDNTNHRYGRSTLSVASAGVHKKWNMRRQYLSLIHISEPTRLGMISYAVFCLKKKFPDLDLILIESGGDNLAATFSPELVDLSIYVIDVGMGGDIPRKGGPAIQKSDLLIINKTDLAPHVEVNLETMKEDVKKARNGLPYVFCQMKKQIGVEDVAKFLFSSGGL